MRQWHVPESHAKSLFTWKYPRNLHDAGKSAITEMALFRCRLQSMSPHCLAAVIIFFDTEELFGVRDRLFLFHSKIDRQEKMIHKAIVNNFKQYESEEFFLSGNIVLAGPNNSGKTTLLQAIATWSHVLEHWRNRSSEDLNRDGGGDYRKIPLTRADFYSVPLSALDFLWKDGIASKDKNIRIELHTEHWEIGVEMIYDTYDQMYIRPTKDTKEDDLKDKYNENRLFPVYIPPVSGLEVYEKELANDESIEAALYKSQPGTVLRNLLLRISRHAEKWQELKNAIKDIFGYELSIPSSSDVIVIGYRHKPVEKFYDLHCGASGFLQILMLYSVILYKEKATLLIDEPDAHLHMILQDVIYNKLNEVAHKNNSQLIISTHSEIVINAVDPGKLYALLGSQPRKLAKNEERSVLSNSLRVLTNMDIMLALEKGEILYLEGFTDLNILKMWARILNHPLKYFLEQPFWKKTVSAMWSKGKDIKARDHFESLLLLRDDMRGAQLIDGDGKNMPPKKVTIGGKLLKLCWTRYEIESYLIHPAVLARFVGSDVTDMEKIMLKHLPGAVVDNPMSDNAVLKSTKAREDFLPPILEEAGRQDVSYKDYHKIADMMQPDEIHPEITEKLDAIAKHFDL